MLNFNTLHSLFWYTKNLQKKPLTNAYDFVHTIHIKPAAPLLACVIRWVFFCPAPVAQKAEGQRVS
jgi:hypothetical protein